MSQKKSRKTSVASSPEDSSDARSTPGITSRRLSGGREHGERPSAISQGFITAIIVIHFGGLVIAWFANPSPSFLLGELQKWLSPMHVTTGQDYIMLPMDLAHAADMESPVLIQFQLAGDQEWQTIELPNAAKELTMQGFPEVLSDKYSASFSRWSNLARLIAWIAIEQPESEVVPEFVRQSLRFARTFGSLEPDAEVTAVRLFQPHALTFDESLIVARGQGELIADRLAGRTLYAAYVLSSDGETLLVPREDDMRTAAPAATSPMTQPGSAP